MLIVVEDGDVGAFLELSFNLEAARRADVFEVDAAEGAGKQRNRMDDFVHVLAAHAKRDGVNAAECLEQHAFAFHDRHTGFGADIAETEHSGTVGDNGNGVPAAGQVIGLVDILLDLKARLGNARRIGKGEGVFAVDGRARRHFELALPFIVQSE